MHIPNPFHSSQERGDTIVEVLIALMVISTVLAGAFVVTNRSTQNVRDTEEHTQALQLLQGQIEQIRSTIAGGATSGTLPAYFCYDASGDMKRATSATDFSHCPNDFNGTSGANYQFLISWSRPPGATTTFTANVKWIGLRGQTNTEQLLYKINLP